MKTGEIVDRWQIVALIQERGHSGAVYRVKEIAAPFRDAILKHYTSSCKCTECAFLREEALVRAQPIPGKMPRHYGYGLCEGTPYYAMEYAEPVPSKLPHKRLVRFMKEITDACIALLNAGYLHCDLKPTNFGFINGHAVLFDFGCARKIEDATRRPARVGTDRYEAPEVRDGQVSVQSEIFSLAVSTNELAEKMSRFQLALTIIPSKSKKIRKRARTFPDFIRNFDESEHDFWQIVRDNVRVRRTAIITFGVALAIVAIALGCIAAADHLYRRKDLHVRCGARMSANALVRAGLIRYECGDFRNAAGMIYMGTHTPGYKSEEFKNADVEGILEDSIRRTRTARQDEMPLRYGEIKVLSVYTTEGHGI